MKFTLAQYEEAALVIENDGQFYRRYALKSMAPSSNRNSTFGQRRSLISDMLWHLSTQTRSQEWMANSDIEDRDQLRRYFDDRWNLPQDEPNKYDHIPSIWIVRRRRKTTPTPASVVSTPKENIVSKQALEITTKTFINGVDIGNMADSDIYNLIAAEEARIKELEKLEARPKRLVAELDKRRAGIAALVAYLDSTAVA